MERPGGTKAGWSTGRDGFREGVRTPIIWGHLGPGQSSEFTQSATGEAAGIQQGNDGTYAKIVLGCCASSGVKGGRGGS